MMSRESTPTPDDDEGDASSPRPDLDERDRQAQPVDAEQPPRLAFPVVGLGASAGGLGGGHRVPHGDAGRTAGSRSS